MSENTEIVVDTYDTMRDKGFEPGTVVLTSRPDFTAEDIKVSAFNTQFSNPKTITIKLYGLGTVQVAITTLRLAFQESDNEEGPGYYETPDWYLEGWIVDGTSTYQSQRARVRAWAYSGDDPENPTLIEEVEAQLIPETPDPNAHVRSARDPR